MVAISVEMLWNDALARVPPSLPTVSDCKKESDGRRPSRAVFHSIAQSDAQRANIEVKA
ncbi:hypothetical protein METUNv1_03308 [Methyloversatilis universalis FAM5]|uniref:Uncharacterized protein n=1 Tax=Methyloversatilis universalis (strain ATCC BAA-1314 / DSM 25237 / JCM 13912 / CCUG 52030 / FAM5) TaxID=1000565 RepID=F5RGL5_METUF|nr:hypothetical protein METUNv1_03308 [Methyloversatilis universalis FAM5]